MMTLILKTFHMMNYTRIAPCLYEPGKLRPWVDFIDTILGTQQDTNSDLVKWTDDMETIKKLDKDDWWKLKAICCKCSLKLYQKYLVDQISSNTPDERKKQQKMLNMNDQQFKDYKAKIK
jgi:hypothetical protein